MDMNVRQKKIGKALGIFFVVMLIFTVLSRAADSVNVVQVQVKTVQNQMISHKVTGTGKVVGTKEQAVFAEENLKVEQVFIQEGQSVKKGDLLFKLSMDSIQKAWKDKVNEMEELNLKIRDLESQTQVNEEKKALEQEWARRSYDISAQGSSISVENARVEVEVAQQKLNEFYQNREFTQNQTLQNQEGENEANTVSDNTTNNMTDDSTEEQALIDDLRAKQEALNAAIASQNEELAAAEKAILDSNLSEASDSSLENMERQRARNQEEMEDLNELLADEGKIRAEVDGVVKSLGVETGALTTESAVAVLYLTGGNLRMTGTIYKEDLKYVEIGAEVSIEGENGKKIEGASVEAIREDETEEDMRIISIKLPDDSLSIGETTEFTVSKDAGPFKSCIPLSALHEGNGEAYVYVIDSQNSVLGEVWVARRVDVVVKDKNQSLAALEDGSISSDQKIIIDSDREISDGSRVRLQES